MSGMPLPLRDTVVSFPGGGLTDRSVVEFVDVHGENLVVMTARTPFHPLDPRWPDQGADRGALVADGRSLPVLDCVVGATDGSSLFVGDAVPVRRGEPGWAFVVVHLLASSGDIAEGAEVQLTVDPGHRAALSAGHTGCHLAALALNAALAHRWRKPARTDGLGHPDFDQLAIVSSRIEPFGAVDTYRIGRSLLRWSSTRSRGSW
jgi:alanyl-tRNA synthetase